MGNPKSIHNNENDDSIGAVNPDEPVSDSSSISHHPPIQSTAAEASHDAVSSPDLSSSGLHRRHSFSQHKTGDSNDNSSPTSDLTDTTSAASSSLPGERKSRFSRGFTESEMKVENPDSSKAPITSNGTSKELLEEMPDNSLVSTGNTGTVANLRSDVRYGSFWSFSAELLVKIIRFQFHFIFTFCTSPIRILFYSYMFVIDPFGVVRRIREYFMRKVYKIIRDYVIRYIYEWMKEHNTFWKLGLWFAWAFLWSIYICLVFFTLFVTALVITGLMMKFLVENPIQMTETLNFDYTKSEPVAYVPLVSCQAATCGENSKENVEIEKFGRTQIIPSNNNYQVTVSLKMPESDYNRNLRIFQVRVDLLSINGESIGSSSHPCMLTFKSQRVHLMLTFLKIIPLLADYFSESQTLNVKFRAVKKGDTSTACLKVILENRAEFDPGAGVPELYDATLTLESELSLLKRILWNWQKIIYVWSSMTMFMFEFLFVLIYFRPFLIPRLSGDSGR